MSTTAPIKNTPDNKGATENWHRYLYAKYRGHLEFTATARMLEGMYLGGGRQWTDEDRAILEEQGRPAYEFNELQPSINSAIGYQIHNRMDIAFKPRGGEADQATASLLSKVVMQIADQNALHWHETTVFSDGLIMRRGFFDIRINFDANIKGELEICALDPMDVVPDPDAKTYDPDGWKDVTITRWLTLEEIAERWGQEAADRARGSGDESSDYGYQDGESERNKFGQIRFPGQYDAVGQQDNDLKRYRVLDRQKFVYEKTDCLIWPDTGDISVIGTMSEQSVADALAKGAIKTKRMRKRVKWCVSTYSTVLFDDYSPYEHFTVVPYFCYFRRGETRSMTDAGLGPQTALNKAISQYIHVINSAANSGWIVEEESLTNMDTEDLETRGSKSGLVLEFKKNAAKPTKIEANSVPTGVDKMITHAVNFLKDVTVPDAMRGTQGQEVSGVAIQTKQFASQQQLAIPLDNLAYTRQLLAKRIIKLVQRYYDSYRIFRITETDPLTGKEQVNTLEINKFDPATGTYLNDVTLGTYDVVISEQPMQVTFENSQFTQALEMRDKGIRIPDATVLRYSNLADKHQIIEQMAGQEQPSDPTLEAKAKLLEAQTRKADAEAVATAVTTQYSALQASQVLASLPQTAPLADGLLGSAGYVDRNGGTAVPQPPLGQPHAGLPEPNTDPLTPLSPARGLDQGIETLEADGVR
ncbi:genomic island protein [Curvibacter sp. HBC61]|uniref:Genomic island protein n=1 Tax=Curvibacter cyanobacteriorum TaxID=3026422 RepID=A0ABT5MV27_9BURK|nr:genomic island protein [Curvibacter sp. HBC61]MDD0837901.1 genomic island protein [Curvibacter sp. HBC61]